MLAVYRPDISHALAAGGVPAYRHVQVYEHLLRRPLRPFAEASSLPSDIRATLDGLGTSTLTPTGTRTASDGTTKFLLSTRDSLLLETVVMRYRERVTACISTQVGCPVGCAFCATGAMGFRRNLSAAEIVDQVRVTWALAADEGRRISNLVYMGMGEPLLNLHALLDSIRVVTDPHGLGLAHRAVSVSTVGIPRGIIELASAEPQVNLALSLHAADDRTRALIVPRGYRHSLSEILDAAWEHFAITRRKLLVEYVLLSGVNDSPEDAHRLAGLLRGHVATVNLLTWNPVLAAQRHSPRPSGRSPQGTASAPAALSPFRPSPAPVVAAFREALQSAHVEAVVRQSKGAGIEAACGQLAGRRRSYHDQTHSE